MNMQAMMKQAQKLQKDMANAKSEIDSTEFESKVGIVTVKAMGNKKIVSTKINMEEIDKEDLEMLEDNIQVAVNDVLSKIDKETESKMGKFTNGMPGLF